MKQNIPNATQGMKQKVQVKTLGGFSLEIGDCVISDSLNRSRKMWNLLSYLVMFRGRAIPQAELINVLWPDEDSENPISALKTLLSRIRSMLSPLTGEATQLILSRQGAYAWNPALECQVDADTFEMLCKQAANPALATETKIDVYRQATALYQGDFLPKLEGQLWVIPLSTHYQSLYLEGVKTFAGLLKEAKLYQEMAEVCTRATQIDPYDEHLQALLVSAFFLQGNTAAALNHYENATTLLYRNLGIVSSKELRSIYLEIMKERKSLETDLSVIQSTLKEENLFGAFVCDYGFFKEAYRLEARRAAREGTCAHLVLLTLTTVSGNIPQLEELNKNMNRLLNTLKECLRKGDVISRYSGAQYVVLLSNANYEDSVMVVERIIRSFYRQHRTVQLKVNYKVHPVELIEG